LDNGEYYKKRGESIIKNTGHGVEAGFIYHYGYFYQVTITPLKALHRLSIFIYFSIRPLRFHDIHVAVCCATLPTDYRQYWNQVMKLCSIEIAIVIIIFTQKIGLYAIKYCFEWFFPFIFINQKQHISLKNWFVVYFFNWLKSITNGFIVFRNMFLYGQCIVDTGWSCEKLDAFICGIVFEFLQVIIGAIKYAPYSVTAPLNFTDG
jgi:hypothetical protein